LTDEKISGQICFSQRALYKLITSRALCVNKSTPNGTKYARQN
jgi:hypothetical protein